MSNIGTNLDQHAKAVWAERTLEGKKTKLIEMIQSFEFPDKIKYFENKVHQTSCVQRLDFMAANLTLNITDKVVN